MKRFVSRSTQRPVACGDPVLIDGVSRHVERYVGPIDFVFHETDSGIVHVDVHHVPPDEGRPFHTLVTTGMAELPMNVPGIPGVEVCGELFVLLPPEWRVSPEPLLATRWSWPVRCLRELARYPHEEGALLDWGDTVQNGASPTAYDESVPFCGALLAYPVSLGMGFAKLRLGAKHIRFLQLYPLYSEELRFAREHTSDALVARFAQYQLSDMVEPGRPNVCDLRVH
jgi:hypothetical protein